MLKLMFYPIDSLFIDNLPPGIHVLQITDYKGCVSTDTVETLSILNIPDRASFI